MDLQLLHHYRELRSHPYITARAALLAARHAIALRHRIDALGLDWDNDSMAWSDQGFDLRARIVNDADGWSLHGDYLGEFTDRWVPGAIRHSDGRGTVFEWFVPANPEYGRQDYVRACDFGHGWAYVGVEVTASRSGVRLGSASLWGIESDSGDEYFTEQALELAEEAISEAHDNLIRLCRNH